MMSGGNLECILPIVLCRASRSHCCRMTFQLCACDGDRDLPCPGAVCPLLAHAAGARDHRACCRSRFARAGNSASPPSRRGQRLWFSLRGVESHHIGDTVIPAASSATTAAARSCASSRASGSTAVSSSSFRLSSTSGVASRCSSSPIGWFCVPCFTQRSPYVPWSLSRLESTTGLQFLPFCALVKPNHRVGLRRPCSGRSTLRAARGRFPVESWHLPVFIRRVTSINAVVR